MTKALITADEARQLFHYDRDTGGLSWKTGKQGRREDLRAGSRQTSGYLAVCVNYRTYLAHRIIWLLNFGFWPDECIDHINGDRADNRLSNLRLASKSQNGSNRGVQLNNSTGYKGVSYYKRDGSWSASIHLDGKKRHLGYYKSPEEAHTAYCSAAKELHKEFANFG
jgi:hypothetical protein